MRRDVSQDESSRRPRLADARRKARFSTVLTTRCKRFPALPVARELFPDMPRARIGREPARAPALPDRAVLKYAVNFVDGPYARVCGHCAELRRKTRTASGKHW
jgi:hypothetical protein